MKDLEKKLCEKFAAYSILPKAEKRGFIIAYRLLEEEIAELINENERRRKENEKYVFMIENGLGFEDLKNDIDKYPHTI